MAMEDADTIKKKTRMLDHDRQKYLQSVQQQMVKQNDDITSLKKDNDKLKQELAGTLGGAFKFAEQDKQAQQQQDIETLERRVNYEKMRQSDLDKSVTVARMDLARARKSLGGVNAPSENSQAVEKQVRVLENRLDQALVQFNEALAYNRELRETIDNLRGERKVFTEIYKKLEGELHEKKKAMADVIEKSNRDYEERDALQAQLESLKSAAREDSKKYEEHFSRLDEMMVKYKAAREAQHQQQLMQQAQQQTLKSPTTLKSPKGESFMDATTTKKGQKGLGSPADTMRRSDDGEPDEEDVDLQDVVDQLKEATGMQDLDMLHQKFVKEEESNFSLFNFVNELNSEADGLEAEIEVLREQLGAEPGDVERSQALKRLEHELASIETQHDGVMERSQNNAESLDLVRQVANDIFAKIGCSAESAEEVCGTSECTELNMLQYFGLIEQRTTDLLFRHNQSQALEMRRRAAGEEEEDRKRRERKQAERQARIDAGEALNDTDDDEDDTDEIPRVLPPQRAQFVGVGPQLAHGALTAQMLVMKESALPTTNTGDTGTGDHDDVEEDTVLDHHTLRQQMEERLKAKREKEEKAGKKGRRVVKK